ncbi:MAG TPA: choice-of-anchor Q domain-containing protein [Actinomycetota bacterium]|nr:choice-of-anchor Q domain-containing protein [Actinomycetota bacterium]
MLPAAGSPAIDQIPSGTNGCGTTIATDQRGVSRPQGTSRDIGAVEVEAEFYTFNGFYAPVGNGVANVGSPTVRSPTVSKQKACDRGAVDAGTRRWCRGW